MLICALCGASPAAYLYTTPICSECARRSSLGVSSLGADQAVISLTCDDGRRIDINKGPGAPGDKHWAAKLGSRVARLNEIRRDAAATDDPAFLNEFGAYVERHGHDKLVVETIGRQRARGIMMDQILGVTKGGQS